MNFVTAHDGFTLRDVVSYAEKHNEANGDGNTDGSADNRSEQLRRRRRHRTIPRIVALRQQQMRNMLATLLCAQGTPMLLAGDEFGRTQHGNNNAYCQDNEIELGRLAVGVHVPASLLDFVRRLVALRRELPLLRQTAFPAREKSAEARPLKDVTWLVAPGRRDHPGAVVDDQLRCFGMLLGGPPPTLLILNPTDVPIEWRLPALDESARWLIRVESGAGLAGSRDPVHATDATTIEARTVVLLTRESGATGPVRAPHPIRGRTPKKTSRGSERVRRA